MDIIRRLPALLLALGLLFGWPAAAPAQSDANPLVAAEAFLNNPDLLPGLGTPFDLEGAATDPFRIAKGILDLSGLESGPQTVYLRFRDASGEWSPPLGQTIYLDAGDPGKPPGESNRIVAAEAFINDDPGQGQGYPLNVAADGSIDSAMEVMGGRIPLQGLDVGLHVLYIRMLDSTGAWSAPLRQILLIHATPSFEPIILTAAEGIINDGAPTSLSADDGSFDDLIETVTLTATLGSGYHSARIRFRDSHGLWSDDPNVFSFDDDSPPTPGPATTIRVVNAAGLNVRQGPGTTHAIFNEISHGQEFVAFETSVQGNDFWYHIHLPCGNTGICSGWVAGVYQGVTYSVPATGASEVEVIDTAPLGLNVRALPGGTVRDSAYDGQRFVTFEQSPAGSGCASPWYRIFTPQSSFTFSGWVCGDYLQLDGDDTGPSCDSSLPLTGYVTNASANHAPLSGVTVNANGFAAATTSSSGYYQIDGLSCTTHQISVDHTGYTNYSRTIDRNQRSWLNIGLTQESTAHGVAPNTGYISDPVNTATGNYIYQGRDLDIPGIGLPFRFDRSYNSRAASAAGASATPLGYGWTHSYHIRLTFDSAGNATLHWGDGRTETHAPDGQGGYIPQYGLFDTFTDNGDGSYSLLQRDRTRYDFDGSGRLTAIADRNDNTLSLSYVGGRLDMIVDTAGRTIEFDYDGAGRLIRITDPIGRSVDYTYDANGDLIAATDPNGNVTQYVYDDNHQIITLIDPRGHTVVNNTYDAERRVVTYQTDAKGHPMTFEYEQLDRVTTVTDALGNVTVHQHDELLRLIREQDARGGEMHYTYDAAGNRIRVTDRNGNTTEYDYDGRGNVISKTDALGNVTEITYDDQDNPLSRTDALGRVTTFTYDVHGNLIQTTDALGQVTTIDYDPRGLPLTLTDALGRVTEYVYDTHGNRIETIDPLGQSATASFDSVGRRLTRTDVLGRTTTFSYDDNDNLLSVTDPAGGVLSHSYDANDNRISTTDRNGNTTEYAYDEKDLLIAVTDALGNTETTTYDALDRRVTTTNRRGYTTTFGYDAVGNLLTVTDPLGQVTTFTYDLNGNRVSATDPRGHTTTFDYDALNRLIETTDPLGHRREIAYDAVGNRISTTDPLGQVTTFGYDALDRQITRTDPLGHTRTTLYDAGGRVTAVTDAKDRTTGYAYDALDRLIQVTDAAGGTVQYTYDARGNRTAMTDPNGHTTTYDYDVLDRRTTTIEPLGHVTGLVYDAVGNLIQLTDPKGQVIQYSYDARNRLTGIDYPDQSAISLVYDPVDNLLQLSDGLGTTTHSYDAADRRTSTTDPFGQIIGYGYDASGNRTSLVYPGGNTVTYTYDAANRLSTVTDWLGNTTGYSYDAADRLTGADNPNGTRTVYSHDAANRLTGLSATAPDESIINAYSYTLDAVGNPVSEERTEPLMPLIPAGLLDNSHDAENRLLASGNVTNTFDANGNLIAKGSASYTYDAADRLTETDIDGVITRYHYDGLGNRYQRTRNGVTTRFVLDTNTALTNVLMETSATGNAQAYNVYGHGLIARIDANDNVGYHHYDPRGSTIAVTDASATLTEKYAYDPFGRVANSAGAASSPFRYLGRHGVFDEGHDLNYIRARYYDAEQQRFISKDEWRGDARLTQTRNRYAYALNSPVRLVDISGFSAKDALQAPTSPTGPSNASELIDEILSKIPLEYLLYRIIHSPDSSQNHSGDFSTSAMMLRVNSSSSSHGLETARFLGRQATWLIRFVEWAKQTDTKIGITLSFIYDVVEIYDDIQHAKDIGIDPDQAAKYATIKFLMKVPPISGQAMSTCDVVTGNGCSDAVDAGLIRIFDSPSRAEKLDACMKDLVNCDFSNIPAY